MQVNLNLRIEESESAARTQEAPVESAQPRVRSRAHDVLPHERHG